MKIVTRFSPSANGNLHLGHIYTALVNEHFAHSVGGKFYVRFDDTSPNILRMDKVHVQKIMQNQADDLRWLGFSVDEWKRQSDYLPIANDWLNFPEDSPYPDTPTYVRYYGTTWVPYPYVPRQIFERVVMDYDWGVTHVIRGEDFTTEYSLYRFFCEKMYISPPKFVYLPRLCSKRGDISKTAGGYTIAEFRAKGWSVTEIRDLLAQSCLILPTNGWELTNIKRDPMIEL